jgi:hypothetical protein
MMEKDCIMRSFIICMLHQILLLEMGASCSIMEEVRNAYGFWLQNLKERDHSKELDVDGQIREAGWKIVDGMHVAQDRDR